MSNTNNDQRTTGALSRRAFMNGAGGVALALTLSVHDANAVILRQKRSPLTGIGGGRSFLSSSLTRNDLMQIPFIGDAAGWSEKEYYETIQAGRRLFPKTIQSADIDGDGRDELLMRGPLGVLAHKFSPELGQWIQLVDGPALTDEEGFDQKQYRRTMQTADIDGDGKAELLIRSSTSVFVYKYDPDAEVWNPMTPIEGLANTDNFDQDKYYETIQCADINGDGQDELIARSEAGILFYSYDVKSKKWTLHAENPFWSDVEGWDDPQFYQTIQCADIDYDADKPTDRQAELLARGAGGIIPYKYDAKSSKWIPLTANNPPLFNTPAWQFPNFYSTIQCADIDGDGSAEVIFLTPHLYDTTTVGFTFWKYTKGAWQEMLPLKEWVGTYAGAPDFPTYETIQCADIDGDGIDELLVRDRHGMHLFKYSAGTPEWLGKKVLTAWSNANNWAHVQFYSTMQTARVLKPGDRGYTGDGTHTQSVLIGRGSGGMQTYRYDSQEDSWVNPTQSFPAFTGDAKDAYDYITNALGIKGVGEIGIRGRYNDMAVNWEDWILDLNGSGANPVTPPLNNPEWETLKAQIIKEMKWVAAVQNWYGNLSYNQALATFLSDDVALPTIGPYLQYSDDDTAELVFSILAAIAGALSAGLAFPALEAGAAASVVGVLANTFSGVSQAFPGGGADGVQVQYDQLQDQLSDGFNAMLNQLSRQSNITGGIVGDSYNPGDYGMLSGIGSMIESTIWNWPSDSVGLVAVMQRAYALEVFKFLFKANQDNADDYTLWIQVDKPGDPTFTPDDYPAPNALYKVAQPYRWISFWNNVFDYPSTDTLKALFDPPTLGKVFPLGASVTDFYLAENGWPEVTLFPTDRGAPPPLRARPPKTTLTPDLKVKTTLTRDPVTNQIIATLTVKNRGIAAVTNVEITQTLLNLRRPTAGPSPRRIRLARGRSETYTVRFPSLPQGAAAILKVSGRFKGGSFGGSFRLKLP